MNKDEFIEQALKANEDAVGQSQMSDVVDKNSTYYKAPVDETPQSTSESVQRAPIDPNALDPLRTLTEDMADAVRNDQLSASRIALAEAKRRSSQDGRAVSKKSTLSLYLLILGILLFAGGAGAIGYVFFIKKQENVKPPIVVTAPEILRFEAEAILPLQAATARSIRAAIEKEKKDPPEQDYLRHIKATMELEGTSRKATIFELISKLEANAPEDLLRSLRQEFFIGISFTKGKGEAVAIIFAESYEKLYPGLLNWEKTLAEDLSPIFGGIPSLSTTTEKIVFKDRIINNRDTRVATNQDGSVRFFYVIVEETAAVFAESKESLEEILKRFRERE